jgi:hypothetical protein
MNVVVMMVVVKKGLSSAQEIVDNEFGKLIAFNKLLTLVRFFFVLCCHTASAKRGKRSRNNC